MSQTRLKRPARAHERIRLTAALGALAAMALITGGLASLAVGSPAVRSPELAEDSPLDEAASSPNSPDAAESSSLLDWIPNVELSPHTRIETELERAQQALERARALLEQAEREQSLTPAELEQLNQRLRSLAQPKLQPSVDGAPARVSSPD